MKGKALAALATIVVAVGMTAGLGAPAGAAGGTVTVTVGDPIQVTNKLLVTVPVHVVCSPLDGQVVRDSVSVQVQQANGKTVSTASAFIEGGPSSPFLGAPFLTCDGTTVNTVELTAVANAPFHGGKAIAAASATHTVGVCSFFCQQTDSEFGGTGPIPVSLRG